MKKSICWIFGHKYFAVFENDVGTHYECLGCGQIRVFE